MTIESITWIGVLDAHTHTNFVLAEKTTASQLSLRNEETRRSKELKGH